MADSTQQAAQAQRTYRAVCFDLDGTLLPMDTEEFLNNYYAALARFMISEGVEGTSFKEALNAGIRAMCHHKDSRLNSSVYWDEFYRQIDELAKGSEDKSQVEWLGLFTRFYETIFGQVGGQVVPDANMVEAVAVLREKGYPLALLTMPLFPLRAVEWRLQWAGIPKESFGRITTYENSTAVKPRLQYYAENLAALGCAGQDVLMVGNNTVEDVVFGQLGAHVYLVTDHLLDPVGFDLSQVEHGTTAQFLQLVRQLPPCENPVREIHAQPVEAAQAKRAYDENLVATEEQLARAHEHEKASHGLTDKAGEAAQAAAASVAAAAGRGAAAGEAVAAGAAVTAEGAAAAAGEN